MNIRATGVSVAGAIGLALVGLCESLFAQTNVTFADSKLEAAVRSALAKTSGPLTSADLQSLTTLSAPSQGIQALSGLEAATNLLVLSLPNNFISDLKPLHSLVRLQQVILNQNLLNDVSTLASCTNLNYLELRDNFLTNSAPLAACVHLNTLFLGGNAVNDISFVTPLAQLQFLDLDHNRISDPSCLGTLTNLRGLDLGYNPVTNFLAVGNLTNLNNLYLSGSSLSAVDVLTNLTALTSLTLYSNQISDVSVLRSLGANLTNLGLSWNPLTNINSLSDFTNLSSLFLDGNGIGNLSWIPSLGSLRALAVQHNGLSDLSALQNLTNLIAVHADYNRLTDISPLAALPRLSWVGLLGNLLDINSGSIAFSQIQALEASGVNVLYIPQAQPPNIETVGRWFIAADTTSTKSVGISDALTPITGLRVGISSSNPDLIPNGNVVIGLERGKLSLSMTPMINQVGTTTLSVGVTNEAGLSCSTMIEVVVLIPSEVQIPDPNLQTALRPALGKPAGALTTVDLLGLNSLFLFQPNITNLSGLEWATNLTQLFLTGTSVADLGPLSHLTQLTSLSLYSTAVMDLSPIAGLTTLNNLDLSWTGSSNYDGALPGLTNLINLSLIGNSISNISFLEGLGKLSFLVLDDNRIADVSPIAGLTNLLWLSLEQNLLASIVPLENLTNLSFLNCSLNLLDLSANSPNTAALAILRGWGTSEVFYPQRSAPVLGLPIQWFVGMNGSSLLQFNLTDNAVYPPHFTVGVQSSNTGLVPNENLIVSGAATNRIWQLTVTPANQAIGTTTITMTATNDAGLRTTVIFPLTVINAQAISVPDIRLQGAILTALGRTSGTLSLADLLDLSGLNLNSTGVSSLSGLQWATNLLWLDLDDNPIVDLSPLSGLYQLGWLSVSNNFIANTSPLAGLTNLAYLNLGENILTNFSAFYSGLPALTRLYLAENAIGDLSFLTNLTKLTVLDLSENNIFDATKLESLANLSVLSLRSNRLTNIQFLTSLTQLTNLDLGDNFIIDVSPLTNLPNLGRLSLQLNVLTNITPLLTLIGLSYLDIGLNQLDLGTNSAAKAVISSLQGALVSVAYLPQLPLDSDGDGIPDDWELAHGLNPHDPSDALADPDGDGRSNLMEYALGSDPHNPADGNYGIVVSLVKQGSNNYLWMQFLQRNTPVWPQYVVEVSNDGVNWYSDSSHVEIISVTSINDQFDQVTVSDLTPVTITSNRGIRLTVIAR